MLVLSRRPQQSIMIGDSVVVTVLEVKGDQVRLGITAPRTVPVHREEVLVSIAAQGTAPEQPLTAPEQRSSRPVRAPSAVPAAVPATASPAASPAVQPTVPQPRRVTSAPFLDPSSV